MNKEKIKISKLLNKRFNLEIDYKDIIFDLKSKSLYTIVDGKRVGCYYDDDLKTIIMYGNIEISVCFVASLLKLLRLK